MHLAAAELATIAKVKRAYYDLYFLQQALSVTEEEQRLLSEIRDVANTRYKTGRTTSQDVLRADLEISNVENELIQLRQQLASGQARLARLLHIGPQTRVLALDHLPPEEAPRIWTCCSVRRSRRGRNCTRNWRRSSVSNKLWNWRGWTTSPM